MSESTALGDFILKCCSGLPSPLPIVVDYNLEDSTISDLTGDHPKIPFDSLIAAVNIVGDKPSTDDTQAFLKAASGFGSAVYWKLGNARHRQAIEDAITFVSQGYDAEINFHSMYSTVISRQLSVDESNARDIVFPGHVKMRFHVVGQRSLSDVAKKQLKANQLQMIGSVAAGGSSGADPSLTVSVARSRGTDGLDAQSTRQLDDLGSELGFPPDDSRVEMALKVAADMLGKGKSAVVSFTTEQVSVAEARAGDKVDRQLTLTRLT